MEKRQVGYVLAMACDHHVTTATGTGTGRADLLPLLRSHPDAAGRWSESPRRRTVDESFQTSKGQTGLDEHQRRTWTSWYRWTTLVLLARAFLATVTVTARTGPTPAGLIPLTLDEIRHLYARLTTAPAADIPHASGHVGADSTNTGTSKPTTSDNRTRNYEDHDLRLEY